MGPAARLVITAAALLLAGCAPRLAAVDGPFPPAVDPDGAAVDQKRVGDRLMSAGEPELALRAYARAVATSGETADLLTALGSANLDLGRLGQAETLFRQATSVDPRSVVGWNNLGVVLVERERPAEAARVFRLAYGLDRGQSDAIRDNLRVALARIERPDYPQSERPTALSRDGSGSYRILAAP